jgi:hypothetical protein
MAHQQVFVRFLRLGLFHVTFPFTALSLGGSLGERENYAPSLVQSGICPRTLNSMRFMSHFPAYSGAKSRSMSSWLSLRFSLRSSSRSPSTNSFLRTWRATIFSSTVPSVISL